MTSKQFQQTMVNQGQEIIFEVVKVSGNWVFPAASSIVEATRGKNMYLRLTDDGRSDIFRLDSVKEGENAGETVFGFVGNGGMDLVELTATTDGAGATTGSWEYEPGEGPAGKAIGNLGQPLQLKGPATVAQLDAGITGIQPGWTYTLTDAGTLTDGSINVDVGDEVAWTEDDEWFKLGGDGGVKILHGSSNPGGTTYPDAEDVITAVEQNKDVIILWNQQGNLFIYSLVYVYGYGSSGDKQYIFRCLRDQNEQKVLSVSGGVSTWSRSTVNSIALPVGIANLYSDASTYSVGDAVMYGGLRYVCNTAITVAEEWNSSHWTLQSVQTAMDSLGSDVEIVNVADYAPNTSDLFDYLVNLYNAGKTAILRYSYAMYDSDYIVGYGRGFTPGSIYQIRAFSNVYADTVNILTIDSNGYSFEQKYVRGSESVFTGTYNPTASPADYSGMPNTLSIEAALNEGKDVALMLTNPADGKVYTYRLVANEQYTKRFVGMNNDSGVGGWKNIPALLMTYGGPGNPWGWYSTGYLSQELRTATITESDLTGGSCNINNLNAFTKMTLTSVNSVTMHTNDDTAVNNFFVEIDNTGNSNDVTIDVQHGLDSLKYLVAAGNKALAGKYYQLTAVGGCWTLAEFTVPTP